MKTDQVNEVVAAAILANETGEWEEFAKFLRSAVGVETRAAWDRGRKKGYDTGYRAASRYTYNSSGYTYGGWHI